MYNYPDIIKKLNEHYDKAASEDQIVSYEKLSVLLEGIDEGLREEIQEMTKNEIQRIIMKLKAGETLSEEELNNVKLWIVGDADHYVKLENNFNDWLDELKRLISEINRVDINNVDIESACKLRGLVLDGSRVSRDILFFLDQQKRVKNFEEATKELDGNEINLLIDLLEHKIRSPFE